MNFENFSTQEPFDFHPIKIKLQNGGQAHLNGFHLSFTYGGLMEGIPGEEVNQMIIEEIKKSKIWGQRKIYSISPNKEDFLKTLPLFSCFAWLTSYEFAKNPYADGSELVLHWFEKSMEGKSVQEIIQNAVEQVEWENEAEDIFF